MSAPRYKDQHGEEIVHDATRGIWVYKRDGRPYQAPQTAETPRGESSNHPATTLTQQQPGNAWGADSSSSYGDNYTTGSTVSGLASAIAGVSISEAVPSTAGDATPKPEDVPTLQYGHLERGPKNEITDPSLYTKYGLQAHGKIRATSGPYEYLDPEFKRQRNPVAFFVPGKVFKILWPEHPGYKTAGMTMITDGRFINAQIVTKIRWFVVVKSGTNFCSCLPISTYGGKGCGKNVLKWHHSIIHSSRDEPKKLRGEEPKDGEEGMLPWIRVKPSRPEFKMDSASRINYAKTYTVEHYVKVKDFGDVHPQWLGRLRHQWRYVFTRDLQVEPEGDDGVESGGEEEEEEEEDREDVGQEEPQTVAAQPTEWVRAKYDYVTDETHMKMKKNDIISVVTKTTTHWWMGVNSRTHEQNLFPSNYVEPISST